jgi:hypothetical protein
MCIGFPHLGQQGLVLISVLAAPRVNCLLQLKQRKRCRPVRILPYLFMAAEPQEGHLISWRVVFGDLLTVTQAHCVHRLLRSDEGTVSFL